MKKEKEEEEKIKEKLIMALTKFDPFRLCQLIVI